MDITLRDQILLGCRRLLTQLNRDPSTATYGCLDRRFWAWKMVDFPEATFQRNLNPICWYIDQPEAKTYREILSKNIKAGLFYSFSLQHNDGSFDQAYPHEHSYGATAFLLPDLISVYKKVKGAFSEIERTRVEVGLRKSADFLCNGAEKHEYIANHLAGAALALKKAHSIFNEKKYDQKANDILNSILDQQSDEGWFPEYGGADPGYQTLCMYYLAQIFEIDHPMDLKTAIEKSLQFLQFFIHPDGTFGGEYGSRRTEIYYPGGIALLSPEFPIAASMHANMLNSITSGKTVNLIDVDMGNLAPLLSNYISANSIGEAQNNNPILPLEEQNLTHIFKNAGLVAISKPAYYAILGTSNGSILKIFDKNSKNIIFNDCGFLGETDDGRKISNQITDINNQLTWEGKVFRSHSSFGFISAQIPSPFNYLILRIANLTVMRVMLINEMIKKFLVKLLINKKSRISLSLSREVNFKENSILVTDKLEKYGSVRISSLVSGIKFSSIHMASSRYFTPAQFKALDHAEIDTKRLQKNGFVERKLTIDLNRSTKVKKNA
jgi:hypothetical protein